MYALIVAVLWKRFGALFVAGALSGVVAGTIVWTIGELRSARLQAALLGGYASGLDHAVTAGPSDAVDFPGDGPYDLRLGYSALPRFTARLGEQGFAVTAQARMSPRLLEVSRLGLFAPYREKTQAGLELRDCAGVPLASVRYPQRVYERFEDVPALLVEALLFIENRDLLDEQRPSMNPALDWVRLARAAFDRALRPLDDSRQRAGASTLATQIEKYRHSPHGRTDSVTEKLRQMASATLRAYRGGEHTLGWRRSLVVDYLNTVPLAARGGYGEVHGIGDGMWAWYGQDFDAFNRALGIGADAAEGPTTALAAHAATFKRALSLLVAQRRPAHYLGAGAAGLGALTDSYLRLMADAGVITPALRDAALAARLELAPPPLPRAAPFAERKAASAVRSRLAALLDVPLAYDLDRLDLAVTSTLDGRTQHAATQALLALATAQGARAAGLYGHRLLDSDDDPSRIVFAMTLFERGEGANLLRVQADNVEQPFDVNDGARLDLGSTAKLRTLVTYLELVAELHERFGALTPDELASQEPHPRDALTRWARDHLAGSADRSLAPMLEAALARRYSASPGETFLTGGGEHRFVNFDREHDGRVMSVREGLMQSVNLVFIRLMRDVVNHLAYRPGGPGAQLDAAGAAGLTQALERFADREGGEFLARFHRKYRGLSPAQAEALLLQDVRPHVTQLAAVHGALEPQADAAALAAFLAPRLPAPPRSAVALQERYGGGRLALADRAYVAGVHPLELWLVAHLRRRPEATLGEVLAASAAARQQAYAWLFKTRHASAQSVRIRSLVENDAFAEVLRRWQRLGYPFETLTPSYAAAIGASGDRPAALAELMGIIANRGLRLPTQRIAALEFARETPFETRLGMRAQRGERVLAAAVADAARRALVDVVEGGTARRLSGAFVLADGRRVEVGGKTGTGDHRYDVRGRSGRLIESRVVGRSATFAFVLGERWFGTVVAYVGGHEAGSYRFTSALPAQLLKSLAPALAPLLAADTCRAMPAARPAAERSGQ